ncbi:hypothetical protein EZS27_018562 [termite gut metagenome]|uniref:HTH cro/C1-type domain-containing protein n=1 Tax=termite gut metagenome TaxID=433724 RepID=A0A5J4RH65_9ZZZZ
MIKNKKQYASIIKEVEVLKNNIRDTEEVLKKDDNASLKLQLSTFKKGLRKLSKEIEEFERLTSGELSALEFNSAKDDMNKAIISFRIASQLTQKELAEKMYIQEQQIQRYEQFDYLTAGFERILQLLEVLDVQMTLKKDFKENRESFIIDKNIWEISSEIIRRGQLMEIGQ